MTKLLSAVFFTIALTFGVAFAETATTVTPNSIPKTVRAYRFGRYYVPANVTFESKEPPKYKVIAEQSPPFVYHGLFRDRVVVPKRQRLTVTEE
jgi:hypothetical protein